MDDVLFRGGTVFLIAESRSVDQREIFNDSRAFEIVDKALIAERQALDIEALPVKRTVEFTGAGIVGAACQIAHDEGALRHIDVFIQAIISAQIPAPHIHERVVERLQIFLIGNHHIPGEQVDIVNPARVAVERNNLNGAFARKELFESRRRKRYQQFAVLRFRRRFNHIGIRVDYPRKFALHHVR